MNASSSYARVKAKDRAGALVAAVCDATSTKRVLDSEKISQFHGIMRVHSVVPSKELYEATRTKLMEFDLPRAPMVPFAAVSLLRTYTHFGLAHLPQAGKIADTLTAISHRLPPRVVCLTLSSCIEHAMRLSLDQQPSSPTKNNTIHSNLPNFSQPNAVVVSSTSSQLRPNIMLSAARIDDFIRSAIQSLTLMELINLVNFIGIIANAPNDGGNIGRDVQTLSAAATEILVALLPELKNQLEDATPQAILAIARNMLPVVTLVGLRHDVVDFFYLVEQRLASQISDVEEAIVTKLMISMSRRGLSTTLLQASLQNLHTAEQNLGALPNLQEVLRAIAAFNGSKSAEASSSNSSQVQQVFLDRALRSITAMDADSVIQLMLSVPVDNAASKAILKQCLQRFAVLLEDKKIVTQQQKGKQLRAKNANLQNLLGSVLNKINGAAGEFDFNIDASKLPSSSNNNNNEAKANESKTEEGNNNNTNNKDDNEELWSTMTFGSGAISLISCRELLKILRCVAFHFRTCSGDPALSPLCHQVINEATRAALSHADDEFASIPTFEAVQQVTALRHLTPSPDWRQLIDRLVNKSIKGRVSAAVENANERALFICRLGIVPVHAAALLAEAIQTVPGIKREIVNTLLQPSAAIALLCGLCQLSDPAAKEIFIVVAKKLIESSMTSLGSGQIDSMVELTSAMVHNKVVFPSLVAGLVDSVLACAHVCSTKDVALLARNFAALGYKEPGKIRRIAEYVLAEKPPVLANTTNIFISLCQSSPDSPLVAQCCARIRFAQQHYQQQLQIQHQQEQQSNNNSATESKSAEGNSSNNNNDNNSQKKSSSSSSSSEAVYAEFTPISLSDYIQLLHAFSLLPSSILRSNPGYVAALQSAIEQTGYCLGNIKNIFDKRQQQQKDESSDHGAHVLFATPITTQQLFILFHSISMLQPLNTCEMSMNELLRNAANVLPLLIEYINKSASIFLPNNNTNNNATSAPSSSPSNIASAYSVSLEQQLQLWSLFSLRLADLVPPKDIVVANILKIMSDSVKTDNTKKPLSAGVFSSALWALVEPALVDYDDAKKAFEICNPIFGTPNSPECDKFVSNLNETQAIVTLYSLRMLQKKMEQQQGATINNNNNLEHHPLVKRIVLVADRWSRQRELTERLLKAGCFDVIRKLVLNSKRQQHEEEMLQHNMKIAQQQQQQQQQKVQEQQPKQEQQSKNNGSPNIFEQEAKLRRLNRVPEMPPEIHGFTELCSIGEQKSSSPSGLETKQAETPKVTESPASIQSKETTEIKSKGVAAQEEEPKNKEKKAAVTIAKPVKKQENPKKKEEIVVVPVDAKANKKNASEPASKNKKPEPQRKATPEKKAPMKKKSGSGKK